MAEFDRKKSIGYKKSYPGCMGGMVNLFDLNLGVSGNKLLTDKPHRHGSDLSRSRRLESSKKAPAPTASDEEYIEEKPAAYELRRGSLNKTANGTPMKMLIAQEMSKEVDPKRKPPSVVARLMGLDAVPAHESVSSRQRNKSEGTTASRNHEDYCHLPIELGTFNGSGSVLGDQYGEKVLKETRLPGRSRSHSSICEQEESKDVYEVWQSSKMEKISHQSLRKETYGDLDEKKMDLVRQKFMEAKKLATDERLRQSKEFQDALEVLSSNRDLFLKFLQEPNSLFSKHLMNSQSVLPAQPKRITVLKPSKAVVGDSPWEQLKAGERCITSECKTDQLGRPQEFVHQSLRRQQLIKAKQLDESRPIWNSAVDSQKSFHVRPLGKADNTSQPTKIVVLKPSRKTQDTTMVIASPPLSPRPHSLDSFSSSPEEYFDSAADENSDSQVREGGQLPPSLSNQAIHASSTRDEPLLSSVLSNGYVGDESSFNRSENEYIECSNLSDSEVMTPTSRHSWDFVNKCSPYSSSSLSRASYSPESSVSREAKKRLSERWALMAHGNVEQRHVIRSSSTLGEMLAIPEVKKPTNSVGETSEEGPSISSGRRRAENDDQEPSCAFSKKGIDDGGGGGSFRNLIRSRSVPASSSAFDTVHIEGEASKAEAQKPTAKAEKPRSAKSFKGKVSSLFFSKSKKSSKEKRDPSPSIESCQEGKCANKEISVVVSDLRQLPPPLPISDELCMTPGATSSVDGLKECCYVETEQGDIPTENQEQPSPVSVLEPPFEDESPSPASTDRSNSGSQIGHGSLSLKMATSRLSSPDSLPTILSWEDPNSEDGRVDNRWDAATIAIMAVEEEQRFLFVQKVLTAAGLDREDPIKTLSSKGWYSSSCPLDPSLLERFNDWNKHFINTKDCMSETAKLRRAVLERKLLFDCMNAVLVDMAGPALDMNPWLRARIAAGKGVVLAGNQLVEEVCRRLKMFSGEEAVSAVTAAEGRDCVDKLLKKEMGGRGWDWLHLELAEVDIIGREIENDLLQNLIGDVISDFIHV